MFWRQATFEVDAKPESTIPVTLRFSVDLGNAIHIPEPVLSVILPHGFLRKKGEECLRPVCGNPVGTQRAVLDTKLRQVIDRHSFAFLADTLEDLPTNVTA